MNAPAGVLTDGRRVGVGGLRLVGGAHRLHDVHGARDGRLEARQRRVVLHARHRKSLLYLRETAKHVVTTSAKNNKHEVITNLSQERFLFNSNSPKTLILGRRYLWVQNGMEHQVKFLAEQLRISLQVCSRKLELQSIWLNGIWTHL